MKKYIILLLLSLYAFNLSSMDHEGYEAVPVDSEDLNQQVSAIRENMARLNRRFKNSEGPSSSTIFSGINTTLLVGITILLIFNLKPDCRATHEKIQTSLDWIYDDIGTSVRGGFNEMRFYFDVLRQYFNISDADWDFGK